MAYLVNQTNGTLLATVLDGAVDRTHAGIALIGKQVTNYGEIQNENIVRLAENFSNSTSPSAPLEGQIWWDSTANTMQVFDGVNWRPLTGFSSAASAPANPYVSDQWWDSVNQQYRIYTGSEWVLVGPQYSVLDSKSGAFVDNVWDTNGVKHTIVTVYHNANLTSIVSRDAEFTPNVVVTGFSTIKTGTSFSSSVADIKYHGTATNSELLGNLTPAQYLRSDVDTISSGRLSVQNVLDVGANNDLKVEATATEVSASVVASNSDFAVNVSPNNILTRALTISGATGLVTIDYDPVAPAGVVTKNYSDTVTNALRADTISYISSNVATINATVSALNDKVDSDVASIYNLLSPKNSPIFTGTPMSPTALAGTATDMIATTAFVTGAIYDIDKSVIHQDGSKVKVSSHDVIVAIDNTTVTTTTSAGVATITQSANNNSKLVATTEYTDRGDKNFVRNNVRYQPTVYVSSVAPDNNAGVDGDVWYQYI